MPSDIIISHEQARNTRAYEAAKEQAAARGGRLLIQAAPQHMAPLGWSRDPQTGAGRLGVRRRDLLTVAGYQSAKVKAAAFGAQLCVIDD